MVVDLDDARVSALVDALEGESSVKVDFFIAGGRLSTTTFCDDAFPSASSKATTSALDAPLDWRLPICWNALLLIRVGRGRTV